MTWLFFWLTDDAPHNYVPEVAVHMSYAVTTDSAVQPDLDEGEPDPSCPDCKGTGKIKTGDGITWTRCDCLFRELPQEQPVKQVPQSSRTTRRRWRLF